MLNKTRGIFWLLSAQNSFERLINTCKLCKLCPCKYFMKTIKGSINYSLFCFSDIHSFNFNFTLTVLMFNLATKNFIWLRAGSCKPRRTRRVGKVAWRREMRGEDTGTCARCQAAPGRGAGPQQLACLRKGPRSPPWTRFKTLQKSN